MENPMDLPMAMRVDSDMRYEDDARFSEEANDVIVL